jgi:hypothetical protein
MLSHICSIRLYDKPTDRVTTTIKRIFLMDRVLGRTFECARGRRRFIPESFMDKGVALSSLPTRTSDCEPELVSVTYPGGNGH